MKHLPVAIGACVLGVGVLVLGFVLMHEANFSRDYVRDQLAAQAIIFTPVDNLLPEQQEVSCLVADAGQPLTTGKQAECYANYQIGLDLPMVAGGRSYFEAHYDGYLARVAANEALAENPNDPATLELVSQAETASRIADDLLAGEATRGLLLTGYAFSVIGDRLALAATICFILGGLLLLTGIVVFGVSNREKFSRLPKAAAAA